MTELPATYRESAGSAIEMDDAKGEWAVAARPELERVARSYGDLIRYTELADAVQTQTGIRTRMLVHSWIGDVLGRPGLDRRA